MRILFWIEEFWPYMGGVSASAVDLLPDLRRRGHEFVVLTRRDDPGLPARDAFLGMPVYRFPFWQALDDRDIVESTRIIEEIRTIKRSFAPELAHMFSFGPSALFHLLTTRGGAVPLLVTLHGERRPSGSDGVDELTRRILAESSCVAVPSESMRSFAISLAPDLRLSISCVRNAVRDPEDRPKSLPFDPPRLLCLGRLAREKGFDRVLRALPAVHERFPDLQLIVAGDGPERQELETLAANLGIRTYVRFTGWVQRKETPGLINSATVVVVPSRTEGLPLVALEASIMGRPIVATRVGGLPEIVVDGVTGRLVDGEKPRDLAAALCALLADPDSTAEMGKAARTRTAERFRWENRVDAYNALYKSLASQRPAGDAHHA